MRFDFRLITLVLPLTLALQHTASAAAQDSSHSSAGTSSDGNTQNSMTRSQLGFMTDTAMRILHGSTPTRTASPNATRSPDETRSLTSPCGTIGTVIVTGGSISKNASLASRISPNAACPGSRDPSWAS